MSLNHDIPKAVKEIIQAPNFNANRNSSAESVPPNNPTPQAPARHVMIRQTCFRRALCKPLWSAHAIRSSGRTRPQLLARTYSTSRVLGSDGRSAASSFDVASEDDNFVFSAADEVPAVPTGHRQSNPHDPLAVPHTLSSSKPTGHWRDPRDPGDPEKAEANQSSLSFLRSKASVGNYHLVRGNARRFIEKYGMKPSAELYSACILVNVSHERGSAAEVGELLTEMWKDAGLEWDRGVCCDALKVS